MLKSLAKRPQWAQRIFWLVGIWAGSILTLGLMAGLLKLVMRAAGMTT